MGYQRKVKRKERENREKDKKERRKREEEERQRRKEREGKERKERETNRKKKAEEKETTSTTGAPAGAGVTSRIGPLSHPGAPQGTQQGTIAAVSVIVRSEPPPPPTTAPAPAPAVTPDAPPLATAAPAPTVARPWEIIEREDSLSRREYWRHYRDGVNSLHPSCGNTTPTPAPVEGDEQRTVTYREERGAPTRHRDRAQGARRDWDRRREDRRRGNRRDQEWGQGRNKQ